MARPVNVEMFWRDGRGPELKAVHWGRRGAQLEAIDYFNPTDEYITENLKHVLFVGPQTVMVTPEEVIGPGGLGELLLAHSPAAMFDLGQSPWLRSFSQRHLAHCRHFRLLFYDELLDVVCERVECRTGGFPQREGTG